MRRGDRRRRIVARVVTMVGQRKVVITAALAVLATACAPRAAGSAPAPVAPRPAAEASREPLESASREPLESAPTEPLEPAPTEPETLGTGETATADPSEAAPPDGDAVATSADAGAPPAPAPPAECSAERWGGWEGTPQCRAAARRQIPGAHRRCQRDDDCVSVAQGCVQHVVHRRYEARYRRWAGPCVGPGDGACGYPSTVVCAQGCCVPDSGLGLPR